MDDAIELMFPAHKCGLYLEHNPNRDYYETAEKWIRDDDKTECPHDWPSPEEKQKAIETNELWVLQWYPLTPIGFYQIAAASLAVLLAFAKQREKEST